MKAFQSTRPSRGETRPGTPAARYTAFQSTRPSRGETVSSAEVRISGAISIHSPLAGRDAHRRHRRALVDGFQSTRPSRGETCYSVPGQYAAIIFQSTRPSRGETGADVALLHQLHISIHSPLAGRDTNRVHDKVRVTISIHSPLAGRDREHREQFSAGSDFNPLAPRGARRCVVLRTFFLKRHFNPLAPRGARHEYPGSASGPPNDFNPLAPRGARQ